MGSEEEAKEPPSEKELKEEEKRKLGIQKKAQSSKDKQKVLTEMKKEYGMSDEEARELQQKMFQDQEERDATKAKVDKKMEKRAFKKELKKDLGVDKCKQQ